MPLADRLPNILCHKPTVPPNNKPSNTTTKALYTTDAYPRAVPSESKVYADARTAQN